MTRREAVHDGPEDPVRDAPADRALHELAEGVEEPEPGWAWIAKLAMVLAPFLLVAALLALETTLRG